MSRSSPWNPIFIYSYHIKFCPIILKSMMHSQTNDIGAIQGATFNSVRLNKYLLNANCV